MGGGALEEVSGALPHRAHDPVMPALAIGAGAGTRHEPRSPAGTASGAAPRTSCDA